MFGEENAVHVFTLTTWGSGDLGACSPRKFRPTEITFGGM